MSVPEEVDDLLVGSALCEVGDVVPTIDELAGVTVDDLARSLGADVLTADAAEAFANAPGGYYDRELADKRIFPALDVGKSGTRKEELLVEKDRLSKMWVLRRILMQMGTIDAMEFLLDKMKDSKTNEDFFETMNQ